MYVYELPYVQNENPHQGRGVFYLCRCIVSRHSLEVQIFYGAFSLKKTWNALLCVKPPSFRRREALYLPKSVQRVIGNWSPPSPADPQHDAAGQAEQHRPKQQCHRRSQAAIAVRPAGPEPGKPYHVAQQFCEQPPHQDGKHSSAASAPPEGKADQEIRQRGE